MTRSIFTWALVTTDKCLVWSVTKPRAASILALGEQSKFATNSNDWAYPQ